MPFRRCQKCGTEFLAKTDDVVLCRPNCSGPKSARVDVVASEKEGSSWMFPVFFLICCAITWYIYDNAYEVELYLIRNVEFVRETMADKLARSMPDSFPFINDGLADVNVEVAVAVLEGLNRNVESISEDVDGIDDFVSVLTAIYEDPQEDVRLKKASITALGTIKRPEVVEILRVAVNNDAYRDSAVRAMQKIPDVRFLNPLSDIVIDDLNRFQGTSVRFNAVVALGLIEEPDGDVIKGLLVAFRDLGSSTVRDEAMKGIIRFCKRFDYLSISGKEQAVKALDALKLYCKSDTFYGIRERGKEAIAELETIVKM